MSQLLLARHGQASFGAQDYDVLSDLGRSQARWLGEHLAAAGVRPVRALAGTLRRQRETAALALEAMGLPELEIETHPGFDEYDAEAVLAAWRRANPDEPLPTDRRGHFRALARALADWQAGRIDGAESFAAFEARVAEAMSRALAAAAEGGPVLAVSSGGVIGQAVRAALSAPAEAMIRLHMQVRNASLTRFFAGREAPWLGSFNETPHLDLRPGAVTWS